MQTLKHRMEAAVLDYIRDPETILELPLISWTLWDDVAVSSESARDRLRLQGLHVLNSGLMQTLVPLIAQNPLGYFGVWPFFDHDIFGTHAARG